LITAISLLAIAPALPAHAQRAEARQRFDEAEALYSKGKIAEACDLFEESNRLEPSAGTLINLGLCKEKLGKLASALAAFQDARARAKSPDKKKKAAEGVAALQARVSRLTVAVAPEAGAPGLTVSRDGERIDASDLGKPVPVDGGSYEIAASAPGYRPWSTSIRVAPQRDKARVSVPRLVEDPDGGEEGSGEPAGEDGREEPLGAERQERAEPPPPEPRKRSGRTGLKATGYGLVGVSVASMAYVLYLTVAGPIPDFESGQYGVPIDPATGMPVGQGSSADCSNEALRNHDNDANRAFDAACAANRARFIAGGLGLASAVAATAVLYFAYRSDGEPAEQPSRRKRREVTVAPMIGPRGGGATLRFAW
jgi:hypothetical protein